MHRSRHFVDENQGADSTETLLELGIENNEVIPADRSQLHNVRVLVL